MGFKAPTSQLQFLGKQKLRYSGGAADLWEIIPGKEERSLRMRQETPSDRAADPSSKGMFWNKEVLLSASYMNRKRLWPSTNDFFSHWGRSTRAHLHSERCGH